MGPSSKAQTTVTFCLQNNFLVVSKEDTYKLLVNVKIIYFLEIIDFYQTCLHVMQYISTLKNLINQELQFQK